MHMLAALDLATGKRFYRIRDRKCWIGFLDLLKGPARPLAGREALRGLRQLLTHHHTQVGSWCAANAVELVFLATYGSWVN
jgi:hypothetical protein